MNEDLTIENLLDDWEVWTQENPGSPLEKFLAERCDGVSVDAVDSFRLKANKLLRIDRQLADVNQVGSESARKEHSNGLRLRELEPGLSPIDGYMLVSRLGEGGFGEVWKAVAPGGFHVALKFVTLNNTAGEIESRSLDVIRDIRHPNLLSYFGTWSIGNLLVIATELADGTLLDRLHEVQAAGDTGIPRSELLGYMLDAAKGIDYLNEPKNDRRLRIQHRDIKPQNLLLSGGSVKVGDFGLARSFQFDATGHTGSLTFAYAAPECFDGTTSFRSDQYSLAITYCYLRSGRLPFDGTPFQIMEGHRNRSPDLSMLSDGEQYAVAKALEKSPANRWPSSTAFVQEIQSRIAAPDNVPVYSSHILQSSNKKHVRNSSAAIFALLTTLVIALLFKTSNKEIDASSIDSDAKVSDQSTNVESSILGSSNESNGSRRTDGQSVWKPNQAATSDKSQSPPSRRESSTPIKPTRQREEANEKQLLDEKVTSEAAKDF